MTRSIATENPFKDLPESWTGAIFHYILGTHNLTGGTKEINEPIIKPALTRIYVLFIIQYAFLAVFGILSNIYCIYYILRYKLYRDGTHAFVANMNLCNLVQCSVVLPVTLMVILIQNWVFGQFMCYFVPLLQVIS